MLGIGTGRELPTILIIDDDLVSREVIATILTMTGFAAYTAESGPQSLTLLDEGSCAPEVILMDAQMPGLSGAALIGELRKRTRAALYLISGSQPPEDVIAGADGFLLKPVGPEALQRLLREHEDERPQLVPVVEPVLSARTLAQFRGLMPEAAVQQIYDTLLADLGDRIAALRNAARQEDWIEVRRLGHSIKGGCGMTGALEIARLGAVLEGISVDSDNIQTILKQLTTAIEDLQRMLESEFQDRKSNAAV